uniref:Protein kinase domain-containing protein n=1 Tax=Globisporangium ultimum (strain ATCC 200006 / CBS 805.95 / DAOM BR144) TaxID=431595 RepID=K3WRW1_GLOUD
MHHAPSPIRASSSPSLSAGLAGFAPSSSSQQQQLAHAVPALSSPARPSAATPIDVKTNSAIGRKNSADDLAAEKATPPPCTTVSEARLLYRNWRTGSHVGADLDAVNDTSAASSDMNEVHVPEILSRSPFEQAVFGIRSSPEQGGVPPPPSSSSFMRSPEQLPRISEKVENVPLFANSYDPDLQARLLSEQIATEQNSPSGTSAGNKPHGGSYERSQRASPESDANLTIKKARSYQALADLEKKGYFPSAPKPSALGVQRGLKDSVVNDMCRAVVKHMVGDVYVSSSGQHGTKKVLNHLYEPVLQSVQNHFRRLPARYALSVNPDDVPMHMRLLAKHNRNPNEISINAQLKKDDDGNIINNVCEVVVVSLDRDSLLDAITRALTIMKGSIMDADVMTTHDGVTLDRFVVKGMFMTEDRQEELKKRIEENLSRLSLGDDDERSPTATSMSMRSSGDASTDSENVNLAEKLGVLQMVDKNEIKNEWKLDLAEIRLEKPVGSGRSGNTYSAWWRGTRVAAKVVNTADQNGGLGEEILNEFHREVAVVSKLRHPNIVLFLGAAINPPRYCLVFEFMENGTLTDLIRSRKAPIDFFQIAREMAAGMNYLHLCSIMHRDLKSGNVLLDSHGTVKISDFGLSCVLEIGKSSADLTAETGTYRWMAPEVIRHEPYSTKADVYSFGVVLWEMITKDQPFRGMTPIQGMQRISAFAVARQQMRPALPRHTPLKIGELVEHCWHQDPARRPDFSAILEALPLVKSSLKKRDFKNLGFALP